MGKEDVKKQPADEFEVQDNRQLLVVSVESRKKRRRNCLVALLILLTLMVLTAAIAAPLILMNKDDNTSVTDGKQETDYSLATSRAPTTPTTFNLGWSKWSLCSATCGNGTSMRERECPVCSVNMETKPCRIRACIDRAYWEEWGQWSSCSKTCSIGIQVRSRNCSRTEVKCIGKGRETRNCTLSPYCAAKDCLTWRHLGYTDNGVYSIDPDNEGPFSVYCDMATDDGGWTVFQRRQDGLEDFHRNWTEYKTGFGNLTGDFWLGNDNIHRLTSSLNTSLFINLENWNGSRYNASYRIFDVASENASYTLTVKHFVGVAVGDSLKEHNGMKFTTKDRDNDKEGASNCANAYTGGWWFNSCIKANLNGKYGQETGSPQHDKKGIIWFGLSWPGWKAMKATEMKLRPRLTP